MATLSQLAKTQQTTTVGQAQSSSVSSAGGTNIQPTKIIDNSAALVKDIGKMFGNLVQEHQQASEYAGKRVGTDNLVSYKKEILKIEDMYAAKADKTSADMIEKTRLEQGVYESYLQKGAFGDNEIANQAFKDTYATPAGLNVLALKKNNHEEQTRLFRKETKEDVAHQIEVIGSDISSETIATFKQRYKNAGLDPNDVDTRVLDSASDSLTTEINNNYANYYDEAGNINQDAVDNLFNTKYKHYINSDNQAIVAELSKTKHSLDSFLTTKSKQEKTKYTNRAVVRAKSLMHKGTPFTDKNGVTHRYAINAKEFESIINKEYPLLTKDNQEKIVGMYKDATNGSNSMNPYATQFLNDAKYYFTSKLFPSGGVIPKDLVEKFRLKKDIIVELGNQGKISTSKVMSVVEKQKEIEREYNQQQRIFSDMKSNNGEDLHHLAVVGAIDAEGQKIKGDTYMKAYKITEENIAKGIDSIKTDTNDVKEAAKSKETLYTFFDESVKYAKAQGKSTPDIFRRYDTTIANTSGVFKDVESMQKMLLYIEYAKANGDDKYYSYDGELNLLKQNLYKTDADGKLLPEETRAHRASIVMNDIATNIYRNAHNREALRAVKKQINKIATGESRYLTIIDTPVPDRTAENMLKIYRGAKDELSLQQYVEGYEYYDAGGNWGHDKSRVAVPKGLGEGSEGLEKFSRYVDTILKIYNKKQKDKLVPADVEFVIGNDGTDLTYRLLDRTTRRMIGNINANGYQFLLGSGEMSDMDTRTNAEVILDKEKYNGLFLGD